MRTHTVRHVAALVLATSLIAGLAACSGPVKASVDFPEQASGDLPAATTEQLDAALANGMALSAAPGAIAGVWAPWSGHWTSAAGTVAPGGAPMAPDMHFRIGDNTKPMTCDVLFSLVDADRMSLDDQVSEHVPGVVGVDGLTLGQLCQSTSGLGDYASQLKQYFATNPQRLWTPMELVSHGVSFPTTGAPGAKYASSNTNYVLLGLVLEAATHSSMATLLNDQVFERLGLENTSFPGPQDVALPAPFAPGWEIPRQPDGTLACDAPTDESKLSNSMVFSAGGVVSTIDDLKQYVQALAAGALHTDATDEEAWKTVPIADDAPAWQGYGPGALQMGPMRGQAGYIPGHLSAMLADPESGLTVVVMLNNSTAGKEFAQLLAMKLAAIALKSAPADGRERPATGLPWSEEQMSEQLTARGICQPAA
ncbi:D-alanyl-D-alanine carboxypeptidase [Okibacterium sp. HSC-33S16]|uniref:serine hydrolase domain-containing protein n=1 Tax=Okibacterium sp. HSC-33S16 TaxID=2910965 RepID=UPI00209DE9A7|nr:serine hydrolase domain-containing protein [Okibacterium sp. HSC-33S16]MCP2031302.1 D-alanyl-D-alanine carboxypeptidase [Okibacterium sp. HSC-33S16]